MEGMLQKSEAGRDGGKGEVLAIESGVLIGSKRRLIGNDNYQRVLIVSRYTSPCRRSRL